MTRAEAEEIKRILITSARRCLALKYDPDPESYPEFQKAKAQLAATWDRWRRRDRKR